MNLILRSLPALMLGASLVGCGGAPGPATNPQANPGQPNPGQPAAAAIVNKLAAPSWRTHKFDKNGYQLDLPAEPKAEVMIDSRQQLERDYPLRGYTVVSFADSDLELLTFVFPQSKKPFRSLDHFYHEFNPIMPTKDNAPLGNVVQEKNVTANGKQGLELTLKRNPGQTKGPETIFYRVFLAGKKVYVLTAAGSNLDKSKAVIDRYFDSLKIDGDQPKAAPTDGKPVNLAEYWKKYDGLVEEYQIDMPGTVRVETNKLDGGLNFERRAVVEVFGTDLEFSVSAVRLNVRKKGGQDYFAEEKRAVPAMYQGKLTRDTPVDVDGKPGIELVVETAKGGVICRAVRPEGGRYAYEICVSGSRLQDYQADIERFFKSFKFVGRNKK